MLKYYSKQLVGSKENIFKAGLVVLGGGILIYQAYRNRDALGSQFRGQFLEIVRGAIYYEDRLAEDSLGTLQHTLPRTPRGIDRFLSDLLAEPGSEWVEYTNRLIPQFLWEKGILGTTRRPADKQALGGLWLQKRYEYPLHPRENKLGSVNTTTRIELIGEEHLIPWKLISSKAP